MKTMVWVRKSVITCRLYTENRDKVIKTVLGDRTHKNVQVTCQVRRGHAAQCDAWTNYPSSPTPHINQCLAYRITSLLLSVSVKVTLQGPSRGLPRDIQRALLKSVYTLQPIVQPAV